MGTRGTLASPGQQRLWLLDQLGTGRAYQVDLALRIGGVLDPAALERALRAVIARHRVLGAHFEENDEGVPVQVDGGAGHSGDGADGADGDDGRWTFADLSSLPEAAREDALARAIAAARGTPIDLRRGPLLRAHLWRSAPTAHVLLVVVHHIAWDGASAGVFLHELGLLYAAATAGQDSGLPPPALQYADFAQWQHQQLAGPALREQADHWRSALRGIPALLALPTDRPRPARQGQAADSVALSLGPALTARLKALAREHGLTLFMVLLAGWGLLLSRLSGQTDIVVGTPVGNRQRPAFESAIGFFANTLALRLDGSGSPSVAQWLQRVRSTCLGGLAHQDLPFDRVVDLVSPVRSPSHHPVFQTLFALQPVPAAATWPPGLALAPWPLPVQAIPCDLVLSLQDLHGDVTGSISYATDLFDRSTVQRWASHMGTLLAAMAEGGQHAVDRLPLLRPWELQLLQQFNATDAAPPCELLAHRLFERQVQRAPDATALVFEDRRLSYGALNRRANQLAHALRSRGVGPDELVGLYIERGIDRVVAMLATLKAGGAYLPLDPDYPAERIAFMLQDARPRLVLVGPAAAGALPPAVAALALSFDDEDLAGYRGDAIAPASIGLLPGHLAGLLYTSGSTGVPKGALLAHRGLCNLAAWQTDALQIGAGDCVLQFASFSFDVFIAEVTMALCSGAALCIAPAGEPLRELMARHAVTHAALPTAVLAAMPHDVALPQLRVLIVGGEAPPAGLVRRWAPGRVMVNAYGPTETTVCATWQVCDPLSDAAPPIGRPIANTQIHILDAHGQPQPIGVPGEIHIAGPGVARGYLNRAELTRQRFVPDPFRPDAHMFRSGDIGRWRPDGSIEYLGRNDRQLKLRGFRIEPGEIEARLCRHESVQEAVVIAREDRPGDKRLVAYLVLRGGQVLDEAALRASLSAALPSHMVPAAMVCLPALPLRPNGKVDHPALPVPHAASTPSERPATPTERQLLALWQDILGHADFGIGSDFFAVGGSSLVSLRLLHAIQRRWNVPLSAAQLYAAPVLADIAHAIDCAPAQPPAAVPAAHLQRLHADAALPPDVRPTRCPQTPPGPPRRLLLTGANGFLGCHLLHSLLARTEADIVCVVRAESDAQARARLDQTAIAQGLGALGQHARVRVLAGDLTQAQFGTAARSHDELVATIDTVVHNAAVVHYQYSYERLRAPNVQATADLLRFACTGPSKVFHHVSTLGAISSANAGSAPAESGPGTDLPHTARSGYAQSKWVAERLVWQAGERGLPVTLHRPANVTAHSRTGVCMPDANHALLVIRELLQHGLAPDLDLPFDLSPVDYVADAIAALCASHAAGCQAYNLHSPHALSLRRYFEHVAERGYRCRFCSLDQLRHELRHGVLRDARWISERDIDDFTDRSFMLKAMSSATQRALATRGVVCPPPDGTFIGRQLAYLQQVGFLPRPEAC